MYNTKTLGKNPYIVKDLSSIIMDQIVWKDSISSYGDHY